jgi:hypothetical protein
LLKLAWDWSLAGNDEPVPMPARRLVLDAGWTPDECARLRERMPYTGRYEMDGNVYNYFVLDLRNRPPAGLLGSALAPLALLSGDPGPLIGPVVDQIAGEADARARAALLDVALVAVSWDRETRRKLLNELRRRNVASVLEDTEEGRQIEQKARAEGEAHGRAEGEAHGRAEAVRYLLNERFPGDAEIESAVAPLALLPIAEVGERIKQATKAADLIG